MSSPTPRVPRSPPRVPEEPTLFSSLAGLNSASAGSAEAALLSCCHSHSWARRITAHRPYPDLEALLAAADEASYDLTAGDLAEALAGESVMRQPLCGANGPGTLAAHTALRAAHAAYESRFGHVFVICLDDFPPEQVLDQVLAGIRARLGQEEEAERATAADELRRIARGRLARLLANHQESAGSPGNRRFRAGR